MVSHYKSYIWFTAGVAAYLALRRLFRQNIVFLETFTHELTHTVAGLMLFQRIDSFTATNGGGGVIEHSGRHSNNFLISLAPYCLPIFTFFLLLFKYMIAAKSLWVFDVLTGLTAGFHFVAMVKDIGPHQTDIQECGYLFSYLFIFAFLLFNASIILWAVEYGIGRAFVNWWENAAFCFKNLYSYLRAI
jgi:hypothetical protein